ncbi:MAG TPA: hypothetical protein VFX51_27140 [Solirubrobacteraceae bacterium]|nr:hypothetical protein [Solirubrobacteraceae bacterium]
MRPRSLLLLLVAALSLGLLAGCGGDDKGGGKEASASTDVNELLKDTFSGDESIKSGKVNLNATVNAAGQAFSVKLSGPFQSSGEGKLPQADLDATASFAGQTLELGLTGTEDQAFVRYGKTEYEIPAAIFKQIQAQYEQQAKQGGDENQSLASLGIDPTKWLTNARNAGEAKVGETDTIKITGDVDVPKLLDDVNTAMGKLRSVGGGGASGLPDQLSEQDKQQAEDAIKDVSVEIYTGADDRIMRRMVVALKLEIPTDAGTQPLDVKIDMQFQDVNEDQEIEAPENARPFSELAAKLQELGIGLNQLGAGAAGSGSSSGGGGTTQQSLDDYAKCIQDANGDSAKERKCSDALTTP